MTTLLPTDSPLYLKRLARELNHRDDSFYVNGVRFTAARVRAGRLQAYRSTSYLDPQDPRAGHIWQDVTGNTIEDGNGFAICASRSIRA